MTNKKVIVILSICIVLLSILCVYYSYGYTIRKKVVENHSNNTVSIYVHDGTDYVAQSAVPIGNYKLNSEKTYCIGGGKVTKYDSVSGTITYVLPSSDECFIYFDKGSQIAYDYIMNNSTNLSSTLLGGMYRFQGTHTNVNDNYICFGTNDKDTCLSDTDKHMFRIIGIDDDGQIKLIKKTPLYNTQYSKSTFAWGNDYAESWSSVQPYNWSTSYLYTSLNGGTASDGTSNTFVDSTHYSYMSKDGDWYNIIVDYKWIYRVIDGSYSAAVNDNAWYTHETSASDSAYITAKISLMYVHDFCYQSGTENNCADYQNSWMYVGNNSTLTDEEWTMTKSWQYSPSGSDVYSMVYTVGTSANTGDGFNYFEYADNNNIVRPVFFLQSGVELLGGTGSSTDPYVINPSII